jgi:hypothetical protein
MFRIARLLRRRELAVEIEPLQFPDLDRSHGWQSAKETWSMAEPRELAIYTNAQARFRAAGRLVAGGHAPTPLRDYAVCMWVWGCRVRRDILALELQLKDLAKRLGVEDSVLFFDDPGDPPPPPDEETLN